ncbi:MAG TPA: ferritin [Candidatus Omnitrophota bacterium]|nr:ferritin [Candidatus Omnitrophota bacterium]
MLSKKMHAKLNEQIEIEAYSSNLYLAMASWASENALPGSAKFLYKQAEEERSHMMKIFEYLNRIGEHACVPALKEPPCDYKKIEAMFEQALKHEQSVTQAIHELMDLAVTSKDYASAGFLQWFVDEQVEEEETFRAILDMLKMAGVKEGRNIYLADKEIGKRAEAK